MGIETGLLSKEPATLAATLQLTLTKTNSYLTDLALRQPPLTDVDAIAELISLLSDCEAAAEDKHLSIPLHNAALRIWLERKLATERLHSGESLRQDLVKLTPLGLLRLLDQADDVAKLLDALKAIGKMTNQPNWLEEAKKSWSPKTTWRETVSTFGNAVSIAQGLPVLLNTVSIV